MVPTKQINENNPIDIFLDSGAFSVFTGKAVISLNDYVGFIKENEDILTCYANLDVISNVEESWKNQEKMEKAGLSPLPVFHLREPIEYLHRCMEYDYFCIGGVATESRTILQRELDLVFNIICPEKNDHFPVSKVHGFGITNVSLLLRYPWYSADSTTFLKLAAYGRILVPRKKEGRYDYKHVPSLVTVSEESELRSDFLLSLPPLVQKSILAYLDEFDVPLGKTDFKQVDKEYSLEKNEFFTDLHPWKKKEMGFDDNRPVVKIIRKEGVCNKAEYRVPCNALFFQNLQKEIEWPRPFLAFKNKKLFF